MTPCPEQWGQSTLPVPWQTSQGGSGLFLISFRTFDCPKYTSISSVGSYNGKKRGRTEMKLIVTYLCSDNPRWLCEGKVVWVSSTCTKTFFFSCNNRCLLTILCAVQFWLIQPDSRQQSRRRSAHCHYCFIYLHQLPLWLIDRQTY